jgi:hypothetical protein
MKFLPITCYKFYISRNPCIMEAARRKSSFFNANPALRIEILCNNLNFLALCGSKGNLTLN